MSTAAPAPTPGCARRRRRWGPPAPTSGPAPEAARRPPPGARVRGAGAGVVAAGPAGRASARARLAEVPTVVRTQKLGEVAAEFDAVHSVERARQVGSVHTIIPASQLRPALIDA